MTFESQFTRRARLSAVALLLFGLGGVVGTTQEARAENEEYIVNDDIVGEEHRQRPRAVRLDDGGALVIWEDNGRGHIDLLARQFDATLSAVGDPYRVNTEEGLFRHTEAELATPSAGETIAVWTDDRSGSSSIYGRRLSSLDGSPLGGDFPIGVEEQGEQARAPRAARSSDGKSLVTWIDRLNQRDRVHLQLVAADGTRIGTNFFAVETTTDLQGTASVGSLPDGGWIVVWSERDDTSDWNIFYRLLDENGGYLGDPLRANTDIFENQVQIEPDVMVRADDILILWNDRRSGVRDAWGRWFDIDGDPIDADFLLREESDPASDDFPQAVLADDNSYAIYWFGGLEDRQRTMVRYFGADREPLTLSMPMDDPSAGILFRGGDLFSSAQGEWMLFWGDNRTGTYNNYGKTFDVASESSGDLKTLWTLSLSSTQVYGDMDLFPDGRAIVAWSDMQFGSQAIFARLLDVNGVPTGDSFQVSNVPANAAFTTIDSVEPLRDYSPHVSASADGFVVTWSINEDGGRLNLFGQFYDANANPIGSNFRIDEDARNSPQLNPRPVMLPSGGFAIAYQLAISDPGGDIYLRYYGSDGLPLGPRILCIDPGATAADQQLPAVAASVFGEVRVAWIDKRAGGWDIWAQRFSPSGKKIGNNEPQHGADDPSSAQLGPSVAMGSDRSITVWETRPFTDGLVRARLEILPTALGGEGGVSFFWLNEGSAVKGLKSPRATMAPDGRFLITWWDNSDGQTQIYAQRYSANGDPIGDAYPVHGSGFEGSRLAVGAVATSDMIQFAWSDTRRSRGWDIRTRRVDWEFSGAPNPVLLAGWEAFSAADGLGLRWQTASEIGFAGFYVYRQVAGEVAESRPRSDAVQLEQWVAANRNGSYEILDTTAPAGAYLEYYLKAVDRDGGTEYFGPLRAEFNPPALAFSAGPNPFRLSVDFRIPTQGPYEVKIIDVTGRQVRSLRGISTSRATQVTWNGKDETGQALPTGVYFARLDSRTEPLKILRIE